MGGHIRGKSGGALSCRADGGEPDPPRLSVGIPPESLKHSPRSQSECFSKAIPPLINGVSDTGGHGSHVSREAGARCSEVKEKESY